MVQLFRGAGAMIEQLTGMPCAGESCSLELGDKICLLSIDATHHFSLARYARLKFCHPVPLRKRDAGLPSVYVTFNAALAGNIAIILAYAAFNRRCSLFRSALTLLFQDPLCSYFLIIA